MAAALAAAVICYGWLACLQLAVGSASALGQAIAPSPLLSSPEISRIIISRDAPLELEGTAAPGDRIVIRVDGRLQAETRADANGRWRVQLPNPLPPGNHDATAVAYAPGSDRERGSEGVQIAIPHAFMPNYAPGKDERTPDIDPFRPNAATRRLAAELAREAHQEFSKITSREDEPSEAGLADPGTTQDENSGESRTTWHPHRSTSRRAMQPDNWLHALSDWLVRARREYMKVVVAALSDPQRRAEFSRGPSQASVPPLPDRALHDVSRAESLAVSVVEWLRRASRDYQDYVVKELALRGIADPQQRQIARLRAAEPLLQGASTGNGKPELQPGGVEDRRSAEAAATDIAELPRNHELAVGPPQPPGEGGGPRAEGDSHSFPQRLSEEARREQDRRAGPGPSEDALLPRTSEALLPEREKTRAASSDEPSEVEIESAPSDEVAPAVPDLTEEALADASPAASVSAKGDLVSPVPLPSRSGVQNDPAIIIPVKNPRTFAAVQEKVRHPPLPSRAQRLKAPPIPTRPIQFVVHPPPPERILRRSATTAKAAKKRTAATSRRGGGTDVTSRPGRRKLRNSRDRHRWCNNPAAGRAIRTPGTYIVAYGDTLWDIAERHYAAGHLYGRIQRANRGRIKNPGRIYPCQRIKIPRLKDHHR